MTANNPRRRGLLIVNLGSPQSLNERDISRFLATFLSDRRVVHWPRAAWLPILHLIVKRVRPRKIKPVYEKIWHRDMSPLVFYTRAQHRNLQVALPDVNVKYAMAYTEPRISQMLSEFEREGVKDLTVLALYPQYAPSTGASIADQVCRHYLKSTRIPNFRFISEFPTQEHYVAWHAQALSARIDELEHRPDRLVFSFHGVPEHPLHEPHYYRSQCEQTFSAICNHPALVEKAIPAVMTFQSKFGPGRWIGPATIDEMARLPREDNVRSILVCTPGFVADCIETLDEIDILNREEFLAAGGKHFSYLNPMNDSDAVTEMIVSMFNDGSV